ncbi:MAG TPA: hypothetical protein VGB55_07590 [Tepidisphaeraceae bacterium]
MNCLRVAIAVYLAFATAVLAAEPRTVLETWHDTARDRKIPVKIYLPDNLSASTPVPVILFCHGLGGSREAASYLGEDWARHGFAGVFLQHPGSDTSVWRGKDGLPVAGAARRMKAAASSEQYAARLKDVAFVLDELERLQRATTEHPLKKTIDLNRIGYSGHSFGAVIGQAEAGQLIGLAARPISARDERIKAVILLSPAPPRHGGDDAFSKIAVPVLHVTGTHDETPFGDFKPADRQQPYRQTAAGDQYLVVFDGATHMTFGGDADRLRKTAGKEDAAVQTMVQNISIAFWNAYLRNDDAAKMWLREKAKAELRPADEYEWK